MARQPQVTRTIQTTKVNVLCLNIKEGTPFNKDVILPRTYKDDKHIMAQLKKVVDTDEIKAVHVVSTEVQETRYGMSEQKFIEMAEVLPPLDKTENDTEVRETPYGMSEQKFIEMAEVLPPLDKTENDTVEKTENETEN